MYKPFIKVDQSQNNQRGRFERYHTINTSSPYTIIKTSNQHRTMLGVGKYVSIDHTKTRQQTQQQRQQRRLTKQHSPVLVHLNVTPPPPDYNDDDDSVFAVAAAAAADYDTRDRTVSTSGSGGGGTNGGTLELIQIPTSASSSSALKNMFNRVSIRRNMYAKSKWSVNM